jgi:hypothetical protein
MSTPEPPPDPVVLLPAVPDSHPLRAEDVPALLDKRIA